MSRSVILKLNDTPHTWTTAYFTSATDAASAAGQPTSWQSTPARNWVGLSVRKTTNMWADSRKASAKAFDGLVLVPLDESLTPAGAAQVLDVSILDQGIMGGFACGSHFVMFGTRATSDGTAGVTLLIDAAGSGSIKATLEMGPDAMLGHGCALPDAWAGPLTALVSNTNQELLVVSLDPQRPQVLDRWTDGSRQVYHLRWCAKRDCAIAVANVVKTLVLVTRGADRRSPCVFTPVGLWDGHQEDGGFVLEVSNVSDDLITLVVMHGPHNMAKPLLRAVTLRIVRSDPTKSQIDVVSRVDLGTEKLPSRGIAIDAANDVGCIVRGDPFKTKGRYLQTFHPVAGALGRETTALAESSTLSPSVIHVGNEVKVVVGGAQGTSVKDSQIEAITLAARTGSAQHDAKAPKKHRSE